MPCHTMPSSLCQQTHVMRRTQNARAAPAAVKRIDVVGREPHDGGRDRRCCAVRQLDRCCRRARRLRVADVALCAAVGGRCARDRTRRRCCTGRCHQFKTLERLGEIVDCPHAPARVRRARTRAPTHSHTTVSRDGDEIVRVRRAHQRHAEHGMLSTPQQQYQHTHPHTHARAHTPTVCASEETSARCTGTAPARMSHSTIWPLYVPPTSSVGW
jgi:hypothetical protein